MQKQRLFTIPGKMTLSWLPEHQALLDEWTDYFVTLEQFRAMVDAGLKHSRVHEARAWIVNGSRAKNVFPKDVHEYIASHSFLDLVAAGIGHFVSIQSQVSATTNLGIARYERHTGPAGIQLVSVDSVFDALRFLRELYPEGKAA